MYGNLYQSIVNYIVRALYQLIDLLQATRQGAKYQTPPKIGEV